MTDHRRCGLLTIVCILGTASLAGQAPNAPSARLANATSLKCSFAAMATGTWKEGEPQSSMKPAKLSVAFTAVDTQDGSAEMVGDSGKSHITVRLLGSYLHFMQIDAYGALYVTTVFDRPGRNGTLLAAHSRHEYTPVQLPGFTSRPEQYYGECEALP